MAGKHRGIREIFRRLEVRAQWVSPTASAGRERDRMPNTGSEVLARDTEVREGGTLTASTPVWGSA